MTLPAALMLAITLLAGFAPGARAAWPERPVTIIVPFSAGGSADGAHQRRASRGIPAIG